MLMITSRKITDSNLRGHSHVCHLFMDKIGVLEELKKNSFFSLQKFQTLSPVCIDSPSIGPLVCHSRDTTRPCGTKYAYQELESF
jgi:CRISPR/Cas system endoribonuclease Cas6 (RAMP superfamily)